MMVRDVFYEENLGVGELYNVAASNRFVRVVGTKFSA